MSSTSEARNRPTQTRLEELESLRIAKERPTDVAGSASAGYRVLDAVLQGEILRVRVAAHVVEHDLRLRALKQPPTYLVETLRDCLAQLSQPGLVHSQTDGSRLYHRLSTVH